jgi:hypothetical protein
MNSFEKKRHNQKQSFIEEKLTSGVQFLLNAIQTKYIFEQRNFRNKSM